MQIGDQVQILKGKDRGRVGRIVDILPGKRNGRWPYYFNVRVARRVIGTTINRLTPYTPDVPLGNYWEHPDHTSPTPLAPRRGDDHGNDDNG